MANSTLSILLPVYNEARHIYRNVNVIKAVLDVNDLRHEFIIVDDGSTDKTWAEILRLAAGIPALRAIRFSRNFGKEAALCAGLDIADGEAVIVMDADLQHPPQIIPAMVELWRNGAEVVDGVKEGRGKESFLNRVFARLFYRLLSTLSGIGLENASDFKLLDAKVVEAWRNLPERATFFRAMSHWVGFRREQVLFQVAERGDGASRWSFLSLIKLAVTAITSFSTIPLQIITLLGLAFLVGSAILGAQTLYMKMSGAAVSGFTTVILLLLIIGSGLMIGLGIIGVYIARIFEEVKQRPRYIITEYFEKHASSEA